MKFSLYLASHLTSEWQSQYVNYDKMKEMIYEIGMKLGDPVTFQKADEKFFHYCHGELTKVDNFYLEKCAEAKRKFEVIKTEIQNYTEQCASEQQAKRKKAKKVASRLKTALSELYLLLILIQNFQNLNFTAFRKILKKHDKVMQTDTGFQWLDKVVRVANFYVSKDIDDLITDVENLFIEKLENGNRGKAMERLRVPPLEEKEKAGTTFRVGLLMGIILILLPGCLILSRLMDKTRDAFVPWRPAFYLYRSFFLLIVHAILIGVNVYGWNSAGVNHVLIFEIDPRNHLTYQQLIEVTSFVGVVFLFSILSFLICYQYNRLPFLNPLIFAIFALLFLVNPICVFKRDARYWLVKKLARLAVAPFCYVHFADFWIGDQFISLTMPFADIQYFICFYVTSYDWRDHSWSDTACLNNVIAYALLVSTPSWFRFWQCVRRYYDSKMAFPHLYNAGKYATTFLWAISYSLYTLSKQTYPRSASNPFLYLYIATCILESTYKCYWDIRVDWGLFDLSCKVNKLLRDHLVYSSENIYYAAIVQNILIRYQWPIGLFMSIQYGTAYSESYKFLAAVTEMLRRHIWNYFRLENEHINNVGMFRAVRDISILPLKPSERLWKGWNSKHWLGSNNRGNEENGSVTTVRQKFLYTPLRKLQEKIN